jgi:hypothetical protein
VTIKLGGAQIITPFLWNEYPENRVDTLIARITRLLRQYQAAAGEVGEFTIEVSPDVFFENVVGTKVALYGYKKERDALNG